MAWNPDGGSRPPGSGSEIEADASLALAERLFAVIDDAIEAAEGFEVTPALVCELHALGARGIVTVPGSYRDGPTKIQFSRHVPPPHAEVPSLVADMCSEIHRRSATTSPLDAAAFALWRLNWIHPFEDGNGRTARALCYLVLCWTMRLALPGRVTLPERILREKARYYRCLEAADAAWKRPKSRRNALNQLTGFLTRLTRAQLSDQE